jgi:alkylation response protein AidB-like acyl-CoA dehydrogenase
MNFDLGSDELALRDAIRELCTREFPVRRGFDRAGWKQLADAGVFSLRLADGAGLGMTEAVIVFEELGRALVAGPVVATHLAAGLVDGAAGGERVVTLVENDVAAYPESDVLLALGSENVYAIERFEAVPREALDPLTPIGEIRPEVEGVRVAGDPAQLQGLGAALTAALSSGIASRTVELAVDYAKQRSQFDKPIGSFQAVKHLCADMFVRAEVARAAVDAAGVMLDEHAEDVAQAVTGAKLLASEAAIANAKTCIQVFGGMGFTWEVDVHLYLKRAAVLATQFGGIDHQAELAASRL